MLQWPQAQPSEETKRVKMQQVTGSRLPFAAHAVLPKGNHRSLSLELLAAAAEKQ